MPFTIHPSPIVQGYVSSFVIVNSTSDLVTIAAAIVSSTVSAVAANGLERFDDNSAFSPFTTDEEKD